jgi:hypothetical protein
MSAATGEAAEARIECTVRIGLPCNRTAVELLLVRSPGAPWYVAPRCPEHPASHDVGLLGKADPHAETVIVALPAGMSTDPRDHRCATCGYLTAKCIANRSNA